MALATQRIMPCLWFDTEAEDAANLYCSVFKNSRITEISRYGKEGFEQHGKQPGSVMVVAFEIEGQKFVALNGGPQFIQRGDLLPDPLRKPEGGRLFLGQINGSRRRRPVRLAEGQIRRVLAGGADHAYRDGHR